MYDGLDRVPIRNMSFRQLRERVQLLSDRCDALLRRCGGTVAEGNAASAETDWANIVTALLRARVNRLRFRASVNAAETVEIFSRPENGMAEDADGELIVLSHTAVYKYISNDGPELWYWNGNEWKCSLGGFSSEFNQTPAGFQLDGTLELKTDTDGRVTVTDSFIKMYPAADGGPGYVPKVQIGYDAESENKDPVIILGQGSGESTTSALGYELKYGQAIIHKSASGLTFGAVGDSGLARWLEIKAQSTEADSRPAGLYYSFEEETENGGREVRTVELGK